MDRHYPEIKTLPLNPTLEGFARLDTHVVYATRDGRDYCMDILWPWAAQLALKTGQAARFPLVVFVQGSAWTTPDRGAELPQLAALARKGYVVATVEHRSLEDGYRAPAFLADVKTAIRFLRAHAAQYCIDPDRVAIWGTSSGGNTALLVGVTAGDPRFLTDEYADQSDAVRCVVDCFGPTDLEAMADENYRTLRDDPNTIFAKLCGFPLNAETRAVMSMISPLRYVAPGKDFPPFLLLHGTADTVVDYTQSTRMYEKLLDCGYDATMYQVPGAPHEVSFWSEALLEVVHGYLAEKLR